MINDPDMDGVKDEYVWPSVENVQLTRLEQERPAHPVSDVIQLNTYGYYATFERLRQEASTRSRHWKSCEHYKRTFCPSGDAQVVYYLSDAGSDQVMKGVRHSGDAEYWESPVYSFGGYGQFNSRLEPYFVPTSVGMIPDPVDIDSLVQTGLNRCMPTIRQELSLINSIYELKDFKSLPKQLGNISKTITAIQGQLAKLAVKYSVKGSKRTLKQLVREGAGGFLQWKFNLAPLVSDLLGIRAALVRARARANELIKRQGAWQTTHWSVALARPVIEPEVCQYSAAQAHWAQGFIGADGTVWSQRLVEAQPPQFHFEIQYRFYYADYQVRFAGLLALLDGFGVNLNPQIVWNAIPWSFVVDWVAGVSRWLGQFRMQNMEPLIIIRQCLWSIKYHRRIYVTLKTGSGLFYGNYIPGSTTMLGYVDESAFKRSVFVPTSSSVQLSGLNTNEFTLGVALGLTRLR